MWVAVKSGKVSSCQVPFSYSFQVPDGDHCKQNFDICCRKSRTDSSSLTCKAKKVMNQEIKKCILSFLKIWLFIWQYVWIKFPYTYYAALYRFVALKNLNNFPYWCIAINTQNPTLRTLNTFMGFSVPFFCSLWPKEIWGKPPIFRNESDRPLSPLGYLSKWSAAGTERVADTQQGSPALSPTFLGVPS